MLGRGLRHDLVPPEVASLDPSDVVAAAADDEDVLDGLLDARAVAVGESEVDRGLERRNLALSVAAVGRDDELRAGVVDAGSQAVGREPAEDDGVDRADARDGEHRGDRLGDHRQVDRDAVAFADAEALKDVRDALDLVGQLGIGHAALVSRLALPEERDAVAVARLDVAGEAVVRDVELAVAEPLREGRVRPVENLREGLLPVQELASLLAPEAFEIGFGAVIQVGGRDGVRRE